MSLMMKIFSLVIRSVEYGKQCFFHFLKLIPTLPVSLTKSNNSASQREASIEGMLEGISKGNAVSSLKCHSPTPLLLRSVQAHSNDLPNASRGLSRHPFVYPNGYEGLRVSSPGEKEQVSRRKGSTSFAYITSGVFTLLFFMACGSTEVPESRVETLPYYQEATFTPHWIPPGDVALDTFHRISPFTLINQENDTLTEEDFEGKIYVTDFFYTICPGICRDMTENMTLVQEAFQEEDDVLLLSHSVTPSSDSVPVLRAYAEARGIQSGKWHLVTGDRKEIYRLGRHEYFVEEDLGLTKKDGEFLHTENFVLVDKHRFIRGIYNGLNKTSVNQLIADIRTLKLEESFSAYRQPG